MSATALLLVNLNYVQDGQNHDLNPFGRNEAGVALTLEIRSPRRSRIMNLIVASGARAQGVECYFQHYGVDSLHQPKHM